MRILQSHRHVRFVADAVACHRISASSGRRSWLSVISVVSRLVLRYELVKCADHVGMVAIEVILDRGSQHSFAIVHEVGEVDVERGQVKLSHAIDLCNVVSVGDNGA